MDERLEGPDRFDVSFRDGPYATWVRRALALVIDFFTVVALTVGSSVSLYVLLLLVAGPDSWLVRLVVRLVALGWWTLSLWFAAVTFLYSALLESSPWQGTLGKIVMGIKVTDVRGQRLSVLHALGRAVLKVLCLVVTGPFILIPVFRQRKQAFHDQWSGCLVLYRDYSEAASLIAPPSLEARERAAPPENQEGITARGAVQEPKRP
jgi:uncharacterized RDD family membrane protein YckC